MQKEMTIRIKLTEGIGLSIIIVLLTIGFSIGSKECQEAIVYFTLAVGATGALLAAYFAGRALNRSIKATEDNSEAEKMRLSYQILQTLNVSISQENKKMIEEEVDDESTQDSGKTDQYHRIVKSVQLNQAVIHLLGSFEDMAIAIKRGIADEMFLKDSMVLMIDRYYRGFRGYILGLREVRKKENLYNELENLHSRWNKTS